jgi:hypothetical protein
MTRLETKSDTEIASNHEERSPQDRLGNLLFPCPAPGQGVHNWLYRAVCTLLRHRTPPGQIEGILQPRMTRQEQPGEIANTISNSLAELGTGGKMIASPFRRSSKWPGASAQKMGAIFRSLRGVFLESWEAESRPCKSQEEILRWAFAPDEFVCTGSVVERANGDGDYYDIKTLSLKGAIKIAPRRHFIVPNPFVSRTGRTKTGKPTNKSDSQVSSRRFVVIEFDFRAFEWTCNLPRQEMLVYQARLHWHLSLEYPLCLLVYSGNESLHGWYATVRPALLMRDAAELGADTRLWSLSQFTRMPWGRHANGVTQRVVFFKPSNLVRSP